MAAYSSLTTYAMKQRIAHINNKKMIPDYKANLFNNKMFSNFIIKLKMSNKKMYDQIQKTTDVINTINNNEQTKNVYQHILNLLTKKIDDNNNMCAYAVKINDIITDLHDIVENSSPVINTPEHPFTKMNIERYLMVGTAIIPDDYESLPTINVNNHNIVSGIWTDRLNISGFIENNINEIYNLVINNNMFEYQENNDGTVEVKLYKLEYEHNNGNVTFIRSMIIDTNKKLMTLVKTWNVVLTC
jgi:hypothetical protein